MRELNIFKTPGEFLDVNSNYLEENEVQNNLILGICLGIKDQSNKHIVSNFLSVINNNIVEAVSMKTTPRAVISGDFKNDDAIKMITEFYTNNNIKLSNVIGEKRISEKFAELINLRQLDKRELLLHQLEKTNNISISKGKFEKTSIENIDLLEEYRAAFEIETFRKSRYKSGELKKDTLDKIKREVFYCWTDNKNIVSIAAIMRTTKNTGVIGLVFTPKLYRGNGYATSLVLTLSNEILNKGFSKCVLYTDKSNLTSNSIYKKIGYEPVEEFTDIYFET
ncbi:MAG: GNAT family N-acetyltransferase [Bacteroidota bacterium]|nr:GNAT family N-acetyltransferase [Bacteroidota bacterium]